MSVEWSGRAKLLLVAAAVGLFAVFALGHSLASTLQAQQLPTGGALAVDCNATASGVQDDCTYGFGETFKVQIHVTDVPPGNYFGFQAKMLWTDGVLTYVPTADTADEALWANCGYAVRFINEPPDASAVWGCVPAFGDPILGPGSDFVGAVLELEFACPGGSGPGGMSQPSAMSAPAGGAPVSSPLELVPRVDLGPPQVDDPQLGSHFLDVIGNQVDPSLSNATVECGVSPTATQAPAGVGPTTLPSAGLEPLGTDNGMDGRVWVITGLLLAAGMAGLAVYGWRHTRTRTDAG